VRYVALSLDVNDVFRPWPSIFHLSIRKKEIESPQMLGQFGQPPLLIYLSQVSGIGLGVLRPAGNAIVIPIKRIKYSIDSLCVMDLELLSLKKLDQR
jgi:hypothetical protein